MGKARTERRIDDRGTGPAMRDVRTLDHAGRRPWAFGGLLLCGLLSIAPFALAGCRARPSASRTRVEESGAQIRPAQLRLVQAKDGSALRREPKPLAPIVTRIPFGTRVLVRDVIEAWVLVEDAQERVGWLRSRDLIAVPGEAGADVAPSGRHGGER